MLDLKDDEEHGRKYHERGEIKCEVQSLVLSTIVQEDHICDNRRLCGFRWPSAQPVQSGKRVSIGGFQSLICHLHTGTHKTAIGRCLCPPNATAETYQGGEDKYRSSTKTCLNGDPWKCQWPRRWEFVGAHHMRLLKPRTRIATPVNCTTSVRFESNASI